MAENECQSELLDTLVIIKQHQVLCTQSGFNLREIYLIVDLVTFKGKTAENSSGHCKLMCLTYQTVGMVNNFSLVYCHCVHLPLVIKVHSVWCEYWVLPSFSLSFTPCCEKYSFYVGNILSFDSKKMLEVWNSFFAHILFVTVVLAATSNMLDCLPVCSVFWKNFAVIYVNFSVPWDMYHILHFPMYISVLDGLIFVFVITVGYLSLTYICDMFTCLMWTLHIV